MVEDLVNMDDVLNNEIGAIRRMKQIGAIQANPVPFVAGSTLPALQYMDDQVEAKTGVSRASMGLDPDALQNATATAVSMTMSAAAGQIEVIARNFAEGGMKQMFKLMLDAMIKNSPPHPSSNSRTRVSWPRRRGQLPDQRKSQTRSRHPVDPP